jgi:hypothetical protein
MALPIVFAFALPFLLWPIESVWHGVNQAALVEEIGKYMLLLFVAKELKGKLISYAVLLGTSFFITETVFYLFNIFGAGSVTPIIARFTLTLPMHIVTSVILAYFIQSKGKLMRNFGLFPAITIHLLFNLLITRLGI